MRFLHLSDLHFGRSLCEYSLLPDQEHWCRGLLRHLEAERYDAVLIAGDLYDRAVPSGDAVALCDWFLGELAGRLSLPVLCIAGNHDSPQRLSFASSLYRAGGLYMAAISRRELCRVTLGDQWGEVDFFLLPYLTPGDGRGLFPGEEIRTFQDAYAVLLRENRGLLERCPRKVLLAHGFFARGAEGQDMELLTSDSEVSVGGSDLVDASLFDGFSYCALGHLHACQQAGSPRMWYSGSPLKYSVSEEKQAKAALAVELDGAGAVCVTPVSLPALRDVRTVRGTMEELLAPTGGGFSSNDYVQITVLTQGTVLGASRQLRNVYPNYLQIRYQNPALQELSLGGAERLARLTMEESYRRFYRQVMGQELSPEGCQVLRSLCQKAEESREEEML